MQDTVCISAKTLCAPEGFGVKGNIGGGGASEASGTSLNNSSLTITSIISEHLECDRAIIISRGCPVSLTAWTVNRQASANIFGTLKGIL
jgi:hypothetical protein